ncbi:hypothetical protein Tc00.1047053510969.4, partial [Trypanosoma cruzi]
MRPTHYIIYFLFFSHVHPLPPSFYFFASGKGEAVGKGKRVILYMALAKSEKCWSLGSREAGLYPWDVRRLDHVLRQATAPKATFEKKLWCVKVILRCIETTVSEEQVELRRNRQLLSTLRYFLFQPISTPLGARLRQHTLSVYLRLLGGDL